MKYKIKIVLLMQTIHIITRCTRLNNILKVKESVFSTNKFNIKWYVIFDTSSLKDIDAEILSSLYEDNIILKFVKGSPGDFGHSLINQTIETIEDGWIYIIDDDNKIHENFYNELSDKINEIPEAKGFIFHQQIDKKDFTGLDVRIAKTDEVKVSKIDMAQFCAKREIIGNHRIPHDMYVGDGVWIENIYKEKSQEFVLIDKIISYYNYFSNPNNNYYLPRILVLGTASHVELNSKFYADWEATGLVTKSISDDTGLDTILQEFNPDAIITLGTDFSKYRNLQAQSYDVRKRWIHSDEFNSELGEPCYQCANNFILSAGYDDGNPLISFFTPIYNTGEKLWRTYESLKNQEYPNWEWVMVNDSTDGGKTLKIAEEISKIDCRCKVYDFRKKSGGIVGESKYRAASLCNGKYLMELDHDDYLLPAAGRLMIEAFRKYPDAKFVYSDCAEITEDHKSLTYGDYFSFGYGSYREEKWAGRTYQVANTSDINPKTIRHIVGVPNHFRAWDRLFYHSIGGHNRRLTIADDYELIVRTFLNTRMVKIPQLLYLQFYHNNNTQNQTRADIQRRVKSIMYYYNERIHQRFIELGVEDWAYDFNPYNPLMAESRFGKDENKVNYIMDLNKDIQYNWNVDPNNSALLV